MVILVLMLGHRRWQSRLPNRFTGGREAEDTEIFYSATIPFDSLLIPKTNCHYGICL